MEPPPFGVGISFAAVDDRAAIAKSRTLRYTLLTDFIVSTLIWSCSWRILQVQEEALFGVDWDGTLPLDDNTSAVVVDRPLCPLNQQEYLELTNVLNPLDDQNNGICLFKDCGYCYVKVVATIACF